MTITAESVAEIAMRRVADARRGVSELNCFPSSDKRPVEMALEVAHEMLSLIVAQKVKRTEFGVGAAHSEMSLGNIFADALINSPQKVEEHDDFSAEVAEK